MVMFSELENRLGVLLTLPIQVSQREDVNCMIMVIREMGKNIQTPSEEQKNIMKQLLQQIEKLIKTGELLKKVEDLQNSCKQK